MKTIRLYFVLIPILLTFSSNALAMDSFLIKDPKETAPDFKVYTLDERCIKSSELKEKIILLFFWMTTCKPCRKEMPDLEKLYQKYANHPGVSMHLINSGFEPLEKVQEFIKKKWKPALESGSVDASSILPFAYDYNSTNFKLFNLISHPSVVIIDRNFKIRMKHTGYTRKPFTTFNKHVEHLLSEEKQGALP